MFPADLELIEAQSEVEDLSKLFGQRLLSLQVLSGREGRTGQALQQVLQSLLYTHTHIHTEEITSFDFFIFFKRRKMREEEDILFYTVTIPSLREKL